MDETRTEELEIRKRLRAAGIPEPLWWARIHKTTTRTQGPAESPEAFQQRVRKEPGVLGVATANIESLRIVSSWPNAQSPYRWLVMDGPPGTGKTTWLAALARRLLTRGAEVYTTGPGEIREGRWVDSPTPHADYGLTPLSGGRTMHRRGILHLEYHRIDEIMARERHKMRGLDDHPLVDVAKTQTLFLDELGADEKPTEFEIREVERIVTYRADHGLRTVIATNRPWAQLTGEGTARPTYGWRVADRLRNAYHAPLGGPSWRGAP